MNDNLPAAVMPVHDPQGMLLPQLQAIGPDLRRLFSTVLIGLTAETDRRQRQIVDQMRDDEFLRIYSHGHSMPVGAEFRALYTLAAASFPSSRQLHLCFPDRLAFALRSGWRGEFLAEIAAIRDADMPLLIQRSESAWQSHPENYRRLESMVTVAGSMLFGRTLDFAWCHLVITAGQLALVLPETRRRDMSFLAEIVVLLREQIQTRDVDWLAWEDPFLLGRDPAALKAEKEADPAESRKRLAYVVPMLEVLAEATR
jgi:hypothetical protein